MELACKDASEGTNPRRAVIRRRPRMLVPRESVRGGALHPLDRPTGGVKWTSAGNTAVCKARAALPFESRPLTLRSGACNGAGEQPYFRNSQEKSCASPSGLLLISSGVFAVVSEFHCDGSDDARRLNQIPKISILNLRYSPKLSGDVTPSKTQAPADGQHLPAHSLKSSHNNCPALTNRRPILGVVRFSFSPLTGSAGKVQAAPLF